MKILVPIAWTLWAVCLAGLVWSLQRVSTERTSPEASRGLGVMAVVFVMLLLTGVGVALYFQSRKESPTGVVIIVIVLAYPLVSLVADPMIRNFKAARFNAELARHGNFSASAAPLAAMAEAIRANDAEKLTSLLHGQPPPPGVDKAGNDILMFALTQVRDRKGSPEMVRILLDSGANPRKAKLGDGEPALSYLAVGDGAAVEQAMRLMLEHGADPNQIDPAVGEPPLRRVYDKAAMVRMLVEHGANIEWRKPGQESLLVRFVSIRAWDPAILLVERGADLTVTSEHGLSLDYYLNDWKDSVFGEHPEGWDRLRAAVAKRRAPPN